jgi:hypothetical protein
MMKLLLAIVLVFTTLICTTTADTADRFSPDIAIDGLLDSDAAKSLFNFSAVAVGADPPTPAQPTAPTAEDIIWTKNKCRGEALLAAFPKSETDTNRMLK